MMIDPAVGRAWVAALRSGSYVQGFGRLHYVVVAGDGTYADLGGHRFCVLGVLCELGVAAGVVERWTSPRDPRTYRYGPSSTTDYYGSCTRVPPLVQRWAGLSSDNPRLSSGLHVAYYNDHDRRSFDRLADALEEELR